MTPPPALIPARNARNLFRVRACYAQRVVRRAACRHLHALPLRARAAARGRTRHPDAPVPRGLEPRDCDRRLNLQPYCQVRRLRLFSGASSVLCCARTAARARAPAADDDARAAASLLEQRTPLPSVSSWRASHAQRRRLPPTPAPLTTSTGIPARAPLGCEHALAALP